MLDRLAALVTARRTLVLVLSLLFCVMAGGLGATLTTRLSAGGFDVPDSESTRATRALGTHFDSGEPNLVLRVEAVGGVDGAEAVREGEALTRRLAGEPGVQQAVSYWTLAKDPALRSRSADSALVLAHLEGDEDQVGRYLDTLRPRYENPGHGLTVEFGGRAEVDRELNEQIQKDLMLAEALVLPLTLILLVFVFRGVIAALLPLALGVVAILGAFAALRLLTEVTEVSVFAINLTTGLGLGLGIDYSLFIVNRYREELAAGATVGDAIATSLRTAGRTVLYSAVTVALSLSALLLFPNVLPDVRHHVHEDARARPRPRGGHGRHRGARGVGARLHATGGALQLVGARPARPAPPSHRSRRTRRGDRPLRNLLETQRPRAPNAKGPPPMNS
ncbi:MMPL family transporter, partial [Streptomyces hundungensis]|uniref:MMPL family transporter n=1 Tax=Streptomyces hundungensis TaxID=1077946 RepID=UPI003F54243E